MAVTDTGNQNAGVEALGIFLDAESAVDGLQNLLNSHHPIGMDDPQVKLQQDSLVAYGQELAKIAAESPEANSDVYVAIADLGAVYNELGKSQSPGNINSLIGVIRTGDGNVKEQELQKKAKNAAKAIVAMAAIAKAAEASIGGMDILNPIMGSTEAFEFAAEYLSVFQETHAAETADYLERSGFADSLSENQQDYLKTPDAATVTYNLEQQLDTAIANATGEQKTLLEATRDKIVSNQRLADEQTQTSLIGSPAYNKALENALDNNPELVEAAGGRDAAIALMQTDDNRSDESPTISASIEAHTERLTNLTAQLDAETDPAKKADLQIFIAASQTSLKKAEETLPLINAFTAEKVAVKQEAATALTARYAAMGILEENFSELSTAEITAINARLDHEKSQLSEQTTKDAGTLLSSTGVTASDDTVTLTASTGTLAEQLAGINVAALDTTGLSPLVENKGSTDLAELGVTDTVKTLPKTELDAVKIAKNAGVAGGGHASKAEASSIPAEILAKMRERQETPEQTRSI